MKKNRGNTKLIRGEREGVSEMEEKLWKEEEPWQQGRGAARERRSKHL